MIKKAKILHDSESFRNITREFEFEFEQTGVFDIWHIEWYNGKLQCKDTCKLRLYVVHASHIKLTT